MRLNVPGVCHPIKHLSSRTMWQESFLLPAVKQSFASKLISSHVKMLWFLNHRNSLFLPELVFSFYANQKIGDFTVAMANKMSIFTFA